MEVTFFTLFIYLLTRKITFFNSVPGVVVAVYLLRSACYLALHIYDVLQILVAPCRRNFLKYFAGRLMLVLFWIATIMLDMTISVSISQSFAYKLVGPSFLV